MGPARNLASKTPDDRLWVSRCNGVSFDIGYEKEKREQPRQRRKEAIVATPKLTISTNPISRAERLLMRAVRSTKRSRGSVMRSRKEQRSDVDSKKLQVTSVGVCLTWGRTAEFQSRQQQTT